MYTLNSIQTKFYSQVILRYAFITSRVIIYANICRDCKVQKKSFNISLYEVYI